MNRAERIVVDPNVLVGKPVIRGTRISVEFIVDLLAAGWSHEQILESYPHISEDDIRTCLAYAGAGTSSGLSNCFVSGGS